MICSCSSKGETLEMILSLSISPMSSLSDRNYMLCSYAVFWSCKLNEIVSIIIC